MAAQQHPGACRAYNLPPLCERVDGAGHKWRVCATCGDEKAFGLFQRNKTSVGGRSRHCGECLDGKRESTPVRSVSLIATAQPPRPPAIAPHAKCRRCQSSNIEALRCQRCGLPDPTELKA